MSTSTTMPPLNGAMGGAVGRTINETVKHQAFSGTGGYSVERLPADVLFNAPLDIKGVVVGSSWRVEDTADNSLIDSGTASSASFTVSVPYYGSSRTLRIKVRKGTAQPKYFPYETQVVVGSSGGSAFISQVPDTIAA